MATVKELRATAKARGLKGYSKLGKAHLEALINQWTSEQSEEAQPAHPEQGTASIRFEVGRHYGVYTQHYYASQEAAEMCGNVDKYISYLFKVVKRTAKYITVQDSLIASSTKGTTKRFYVKIDGQGIEYIKVCYGTEINAYTDLIANPASGDLYVVPAIEESAPAASTTKETEGILGSFTFSYTECKEQKEIACTIQVESMPPITSGIQAPGATVWKLYDESNEFVGAYAPMLDILEFMYTYRRLDYKWTLRAQFEKQFRKRLPELLKRAGHIDSEGNFISDGDEEVRYQSYKVHTETTKASQKGTSLTTPKCPYTNGNDKDDPLTWKETPYRSQALRIAFAIIHNELGVESYRNRRGGSVLVKYLSKRVKELRRELYKLYELQLREYEAVS